jgi:hypothetical protein
VYSVQLCAQGAPRGTLLRVSSSLPTLVEASWGRDDDLECCIRTRICKPFLSSHTGIRILCSQPKSAVRPSYLTKLRYDARASMSGGDNFPAMRGIGGLAPAW